MNTSKMKNIIVLKNLPSNIIDEAIVFLKTNKKVTARDSTDISKNINKTTNKTNTRDYVMQEAENVITNYLSQIEEDKKIKVKNIDRLQKKYMLLKRTIKVMAGIIIIYTIVLIGIL